MNYLLIILRFPVYLLGLSLLVCISAVLCPIVFVVHIFISLIHLLYINVIMIIAIPFVILYAAFINGTAWSDFKESWKNELDIRKSTCMNETNEAFKQLNTWLIEGPK